MCAALSGDIPFAQTSLTQTQGEKNTQLVICPEFILIRQFSTIFSSL